MPPVDVNGIILPELVVVLNRQVKVHGNHFVNDLLASWAGQSVEDAT